ncbi:hypothetical protein H6G89_15460 [Oscillatoria sp. FACHB-1407]|uniref:DUF7734 family protein n=1 Tax=Oscillatoria sp. FACHB-1407 TaxID=2692847 RepID=UPI00168478A0|nr:hypothetical protein [Oscillatoria sp. FACHB-1407]MBD2462444.1 hypothetical protein [Oscillatoria sp. FACHB-1407]
MSQLGYRLEQYTIKRPQEVLLVTVEIDGELDQILIFKGFSSSLIRPTAYDPDVPMLSDDAHIVAIDRLQAPYLPDNPHYLQQGLTVEAIHELLEVVGV